MIKVNLMDEMIKQEIRDTYKALDSEAKQELDNGVRQRRRKELYKWLEQRNEAVDRMTRADEADAAKREMKKQIKERIRESRIPARISAGHYINGSKPPMMGVPSIIEPEGE